jgi:hypothetical protein
MRRINARKELLEAHEKELTKYHAHMARLRADKAREAQVSLLRK